MIIKVNYKCHLRVYLNPTKGYFFQSKKKKSSVDVTLVYTLTTIEYSKKKHFFTFLKIILGFKNMNNKNIVNFGQKHSLSIDAKF